MGWELWMVITALCYALVSPGIKLASGRIGSFTGAFVMNLAAALLVLGFLIISQKGSEGNASTVGIIIVLCVGAALAIGNVSNYLMYANNAPLSVALPLISVASIALSAFLAVFVFKEAITLQKALGLLFACITIWLLKG